MAVAGWIVLGAIVGVLSNRIAGHGSAALASTVLGGMVGALVSGTVVSVAFGLGPIRLEAGAAAILLVGGAAVLIRLKEARLGRPPAR